MAKVSKRTIDRLDSPRVEYRIEIAVVGVDQFDPVKPRSKSLTRYR